MKILFILNPVSGGKKKIDWQPLIHDYFALLPHRIVFYTLTGNNDKEAIGNSIKNCSPDRVVAVGGDGTINLVCKELLHSAIPMGILPAGSANGMAKELKIDENPSIALDTILNGKVQQCDIIQINEDDISIHLSDLGLNARLVKYFDKDIRGMWGYARVFLKILWQRRLLTAHIQGDDLDIKISAYMIVIANASKYGTGAIINPEGLTHDGKFELVIVRKISLIAMIKMFVSHRPFDPEKVEIFQTTKAVITTKKGVNFQVDGEYKGKVNQVTAQILPSAVQLMVRE